MSRKQGSWIVAIFTIALLFSLVINIPARQILRVVVLPPEVDIQGIQGTLTRGKVEYVSYQGFQLTDIDFELRPLCLFKVAICYELSAEANGLNLNIEGNLLSQNISIHESQINLGSEFIDTVPGLLVKPAGQFVLKVEQITLVDFKIDDMLAAIDWVDAGIQGEKQTLGNYNALITRQADNIAIVLSDKDSLLSVTGDINVKLDGRYNMDIQFVSRPQLDRSVISVLEIAARKTGLNQFSLKKTGMLPPQMLNSLKYIQPPG